MKKVWTKRFHSHHFSHDSPVGKSELLYYIGGLFENLIERNKKPYDASYSSDVLRLVELFVNSKQQAIISIHTVRIGKLQQAF